MSQEQAYLNAAQGYKRYENQEASKLMSYKAGHFLHDKASVEMEKNNLNIAQRRLNLEMVMIELESQMASLGIVFNNEDKTNLQIKAKTISRIVKTISP